MPPWCILNCNWQCRDKTKNKKYDPYFTQWPKICQKSFIGRRGCYFRVKMHIGQVYRWKTDSLIIQLTGDNFLNKHDITNDFPQPSSSCGDLEVCEGWWGGECNKHLNKTTTLVAYYRRITIQYIFIINIYWNKHCSTNYDACHSPPLPVGI